MEENKEEIKEVKDVKKIENSKAVAIIIIVLLMALLAGIAIWYFKTTKRQNIIANEISANVSSNNVIENKITNVISNEIANVIENVISNNEIEAEKVEKEKVTEEEKKSEDTKKEESKKAEKQSEKKGEEKQTKSEDTKIKETKTETKKDEQKTENKETDKKEETNKTSEVKPAEPVKPIKTGTDKSKELTNSETKYGVKTNTYTITYYDVYSDGSKVETGKKTETEYDNSGYSATTTELLPEAKQVKSQNASMINEVLKYVNEYRREANENAVNGITDRKDLVLDSNLTAAACVRAMEMGYAGIFTHTRPNGSNCFTVLKDMDIFYYACGENIAKGQTSAKGACTTWKGSSGHYANMISNNYGKIGIGVFKYRGTYNWVQIFTN